MNVGPRADSVLEVEVREHATAGTWIKNLFYAFSGTQPDPMQFDVRVKVRSSGQVVYSIQLDAGIAAEEGIRMLQTDLERLSVEEFCVEHEITLPS